MILNFKKPIVKKVIFFLILSNLTNYCLSQTPTFVNIDDGTSFSALVGTVDLKQYTASESCSWRIDPDDGQFEITTTTGGIFANQATITYDPDPTVSSTECPALDNYDLIITDFDGNEEVLPITACKTFPEEDEQPVDIVFAIDVSGSMGGMAACEPNSSNCTENNRDTENISKLDYIKTKLESIVNTLQPILGSDGLGNRFGMVTFADIATRRIDLTPFNDLTLTQAVQQVTDEIDGIQSGGLTAMGLGIREAINMLGGIAENAERRRIIILFTNGKQNVNPIVKAKIITNAEGIEEEIIEIESSDLTEAMGLTNSDIGIFPNAIFTPEGEYLELLEKLANLNGARSHNLASATHVCCLTDDLTLSFVDGAAETGSPKLLHFRTNKLNGTSGQESFSIKEKLDILSVNVSSVGSHNYTSIKVEKVNNGTPIDITSYGKIIPPLNTPSQHRVFSASFPLPIVGGDNTAGDYRFKFTANKANISYESAAIIDDRGLKQNFFASPINAAGEDMFLGAYLAQGGNPVTDAQVTAYIYSPKKSLGNELANIRVPSEFIKTKGPWGSLIGNKSILQNQAKDIPTNISKSLFEKGGVGAYIKNITLSNPKLPSFQIEGSRMSNGDKKYRILLNEKKVTKAFEQQLVKKITLRHEGGGIYKAKFKGTEKTGLYHVRFEAKGNHPQIGTYLRTAEKTPVVRFGTPDKQKSSLFQLYEAPVVLSLKPIDLEGNLLGPNQVSAIEVKLSQGTADVPVDYLNGVYVIRLSEEAQKSDPIVTIKIHGRLLYNGKLSKIRKKRGFISFHFGQTRPESDLTTPKDNKLFGDVKLGFHITKRIGLLAKGGYYTFKNPATDAIDFETLGLGIGLNYRLWIPALTGVFIQPEFIPTYYKPKDTDWTFGYNYGVSIVKPLGHFTNLTIDGNYHRINVSRDVTKFYTAGAGLQFRF